MVLVVKDRVHKTLLVKLQHQAWVVTGCAVLTGMKSKARNVQFGILVAPRLRLLPRHFQPDLAWQYGAHAGYGSAEIICQGGGGAADIVDIVLLAEAVVVALLVEAMAAVPTAKHWYR
jgi:hypothetical protein